MRFWAWIFLIVTVLVSLIQLAVFLPSMPEEVASHFGVNGQPDGFMSRKSFGTFMLAMNVGLPLFVVGCAYLVRVLPVSLVNLPNREYWLAESRRGDTVRTLEAMLIWIAVASSFLMIGLFQLTYEANQLQQNLNSAATIALVGVYMV
ncbi:MAG: DUF1648 domain-containing protein, partial [Pirellulaceae bacterium]